MNQLFNALLSTAAVATLASAVPAQNVLVLDKNAGPYFNLPDVLGAALDGDTILVGPGTYASTPNIDSLSLNFVATGSATFRSWRVRGLGADQVVTFRGIKFQRNNSTQLAGATNISILNHEGLVVFEDCRFKTNTAVAGPGATYPSVEATSPAGSPGKVLFSHCIVDGGAGGEILTGAIPPMVPSPAIAGTGVELAVFDSTVTGGPSNEVEAGAVAIRLADGRLYLAGSSVVGGAGGADGASTCDGGAGGDGVSGTGSVTLVASTVDGGPGGVGCTTGSPGLQHSLTGSFLDTGGLAPSLELTPATLNTGDTATLDVLGPAPPGGTAWVLQAGLTPTLEPFFGTPGTSGVSTLLNPLPIGPPRLLLGGVDQLSFVASFTGLPGQDGVLVHTQGIFLDAAQATVYFSAPSFAVVTVAGFDPL